MSLHCHRCGRELERNVFGRDDGCPGCGADTRCCRNCEFDDPACGTQCQETQAEAISDREYSNFCDFFKPRAWKQAPVMKPRLDGNVGQSAFDALFRKPGRDKKN